ncbi:MAG TPA: right-handed parallel beta-helix repeat-containing protein [Terriglobia bacterium]|nr:right-handed parallel beta-helix repeat-containing protein [Terriglobia bacterium]
MAKPDRLNYTRRGFMGAAAMFAGGAFAAVGNASAQAGMAPPRTTATAAQQEPAWDALSVTVGPQKADLVGASEKVIQAAVDYIAGWGGGTVRILPGTYRMRNSVSLRSGVRILGSGEDSVLAKEPEVKTKLAEDSTSWQQEIVLADPSGFEVGDGVCLQVIDEWHQGAWFIQRSLAARNGNRFKLNKPLSDDDFTVKGKATIGTLFPLLNVDGVSDVRIENIALDGNRVKQESLYHNWGNILGGIWLNKSNRIQMRKIISRESCADGISAQTCNDVLIEDCHCLHNVGFGIHSGTGSQRHTVRNNRLENNYIGYYFCWGVRFGLAENNTILNNSEYGVRLGQKDTDNVVRNNEIRNSGKVGVIFERVDDDPAYSPDRNRLEGNHIIDSGGETGVGVDVMGVTKDAVIERNEIAETRQPLKRIGLRIGARTRDVKIGANTVTGFSVNVLDLRKVSAKG